MLLFETNVLQELFDTMDGKHWKRRRGWGKVKDLSKLTGVTVEGGWVTELDLHDNELKGRVPKY